MSSRTIYALSTYYAKSAIAIVRVSGDDSLTSLKKITKKSNFIPNKAITTNLYNQDNEIIDKSLVLYFKSPNSYTGEDVVEYHIHGSLYVIKELLQTLSYFNNHYMAEAGEFTKKALQNNKIDLIEAEAIADLIHSETKEQKKLALREMSGEISSKYKIWYEDLKEILALVESTIDFSDQDIPPETFNYISKNINNLIADINKEVFNGHKIRKIKEGIKVSIIGNPNTGKSSLINYFSQRDIAIVSNIPGTTRDYIEVFLDIGGFSVSMYDTAGIRETSEEIEKEGIKRAINIAKQSDIKIIMIDGSLNDDYSHVLEFMDEENSIIIVNKSDILLDNFDKNILNKSILISIKNKLGLQDLENLLINKFKEICGTIENSIVIQERHNKILSDTLKELKLANENHHDIILMSFYLRNSLNEIGKIMGKFNIEDILDIVFSNFCIGK